MGGESIEIFYLSVGEGVGIKQKVGRDWGGKG